MKAPERETSTRVAEWKSTIGILLPAPPATVAGEVGVCARGLDRSVPANVELAGGDPSRRESSGGDLGERRPVRGRNRDGVAEVVGNPALLRVPHALIFFYVHCSSINSADDLVIATELPAARRWFGRGWSRPGCSCATKEGGAVLEGRLLPRVEECGACMVLSQR